MLKVAEPQKKCFEVFNFKICTRNHIFEVVRSLETWESLYYVSESYVEAVKKKLKGIKTM